MFKKVLILSLLFLLSVSLFSYTGPNVKYPFKQTSWAGGDGQAVFNDDTKFLTSERIHFLTSPLTLGFIEDTNFSVVSTLSTFSCWNRWNYKWSCKHQWYYLRFRWIKGKPFILNIYGTDMDIFWYITC